MTAEEWRPVPNYQGLYDVSNMGNVRSLDRRVRSRGGGEYLKPGRALKPGPTSQGYLTVVLIVDGARKTRTVHSLVAEAFIGPRPPGLEVLHWDDDPLNNRAGNLRYGTSSENRRDRMRNGSDHNANKTECPAGHEYSPENTYHRPDGGRDCRECKRQKVRERMRRLRARKKQRQEAATTTAA